MSYTSPQVGESASQYSSTSVPTEDRGKRSESDAPIDQWNTDDYREDGALAASNPYGVTDDNTGDGDSYGPGTETEKLN